MSTFEPWAALIGCLVSGEPSSPARYTCVEGNPKPMKRSEKSGKKKLEIHRVRLIRWNTWLTAAGRSRRSRGRDSRERLRTGEKHKGGKRRCARGWGAGKGGTVAGGSRRITQRVEVRTSEQRDGLDVDPRFQPHSLNTWRGREEQQQEGGGDGGHVRLQMRRGLVLEPNAGYLTVR